MRLASGAANVKEIDPSYSPVLISEVQGNRPGTAASARSRRNSLRGIVRFDCVEIWKRRWKRRSNETRKSVSRVGQGIKPRSASCISKKYIEQNKDTMRKE